MAPGQFQCPRCDKRFKRIEHMRRHRISHDTERPFSCSTCQRTFTRNDALQRHQITHTQQNPNLLQRKVRACLNCAAARVRCTAESPRCGRCSNRTLECIYPETKPTGTQGVYDDQAQQMEQPPMPPPEENTSPLNDHGSVQSPSSGGTSGHPQQSYGAPTGLGGNSMQLPMQQQQQVAPQMQDSPFSYAGMNGEFGQASAGGFEFDTGIFSSLNWLPLDSQMIYQDTTPLNTSVNWYGLNTLPLVEPQIQGTVRSFAEQASLSVHSSSSSAELSKNSHDKPSVGGRSSQATDSRVGTTISGEYYVDGDGARLPRVKRRRLLSKSSSRPYIQDRFTLELSDPIDSRPSSRTEVLPQYEISQEYHQTMSSLFEQTCVSSTSPRKYTGSSFPAKWRIEWFISLYFEHFDPVFPFLHAPTFTCNDEPHQLVSAIAAIGSHYAEHVDDGFSRSMHEYVRRVLETNIELECDNDRLALANVQAQLLNAIGLAYCGDKKLATLKSKYHGELSSFCLSQWTHSHSTTHDLSNSTASDTDDIWHRWIREESFRRTGYTIWLLDTFWHFQFEDRTSMALGDADVPLPCQEKLWHAPASNDWARLYPKSPPSCTLLEALDDMYVKKRLHHHTGELSRILIIHGLFRRNWEVEAYLRQPFARWEPSAHLPQQQQRQGASSSSPAPAVMVPRRQIWMPADQTYSRWRNATCDCLDLLHWSANATIGRNLGIEHPTVLHLHLSRVILLAPFKAILAYARAYCQPAASASEQRPESSSSGRRLVQLWATQDQHKARLAMIHAGVVFWHVRRYSSNAFYEPSAVLLSTLALWAYSQFAGKRKVVVVAVAGQEDHQARSEMEAGSPPMQTPPAGAPKDPDDLPMINLDRPTDDELVQLFVKHGASMHAVVTGVGDVHGVDGPKRILVEGKKLLHTLDCWGIHHRLVDFLDRILNMTAE